MTAGLGNIACDGCGSDARGHGLGDGRIELRRGSNIIDSDIETGPRQAKRDGFADAAPCTSDESDRTGIGHLRVRSGEVRRLTAGPE